jgi:uncharacterized protein YyaL (SSP411 family)
VTEQGNFEGHNVLHRPKSWQQAATSGNGVKIYICTNETCMAPLEGSKAVEKWLDGL